VNTEAGFMNIAFIGCGFVSDLYMASLVNHPDLKIVGVHDRDVARMYQFCRHYGLRPWESLEAMLRDSGAVIAVNLTNPSAHYEINRMCLEAGLHVYCEKPLAMTYEQARELVEVARAKGLQISGAPCNVLSETAQTVWKAIREDAIGDVRLVYAELDDGFLPEMPYRQWHSASGAAWPYRDEFEVGCTLEHAGYYLGWLAAFFGPAESVAAMAECCIPDKGVAVNVATPDFSVAVVKFRNGVVARVTCSIIAKHDHHIRFFGDRGTLEVEDCWFYRAPVKLRSRFRIRRRLIEHPFPRKLPLVGMHLPALKRRGAAAMDFCRGIAELAAGIKEGRPSVLSADFTLHITELALAIHYATQGGNVHFLKSSFEPIKPMAWSM
jgi:predicted dehydrogenase